MLDPQIIRFGAVHQELIEQIEDPGIGEVAYGVNRDLPTHTQRSPRSGAYGAPV
jgi:hypothetical protein